MRPLVLLGAGAIGAGCGGDEMDVMLTRVGDRPIQVIKEVRAAKTLKGSDPFRRVVEGL